VKVRTNTPDPRGGKDVKKEAFLGDYKEVQGARVPMRLRTYRGGELLVDMTLIEVQFFNRIDGKVFAKP
jgi:hypothetical protein